MLLEHIRCIRWLKQQSLIDSVGIYAINEHVVYTLKFKKYHTLSMHKQFFFALIYVKHKVSTTIWTIDIYIAVSQQQ